MSIRQGKIIIADSVSSTTDYQDLINKPKINGVELDGNKTTEDLNINVGITSVNGDTGTNGAVTVKAIENANPNDTMLKIWNGTTAEYLALAEKDLNTVYNVTDEVTADSSKISGFNLFDFKWSDHIINNISWTRADNFSWHSAAVYVSAYNKLLKEKERASTVLETETIDDITISFYRSENNYKICLPDQLANLTSLYEKTGVAWYYVIDTENKQFKLPRTKWGFTGLRNKAGDYVSESVPNITGRFGSGMTQGNFLNFGIGAFGSYEDPTNSQDVPTVGGNYDSNNRWDFDASRSSSAYKDGAPVQERATEMYLYFYVGNTVTVESEVNLDTLVTDVEKLKKDSGGSLEIGDIGFSAFGIDETKNLRRYLNGQVISQAQFVSFTDKLKSIVALYPNLATTEENWQAEVTNSKLGQCGKFVIDDTAGTIRLPKVVNINGLQDLALMGSIKAESLPNIKGESPIHANPDYPLTGVFGVTDSYHNGQLISGYDSYYNLDFDASRSSSTYQDNAPVQPESIQYPYFIQVATGVEESVDVTREIELNNPFSLLDYKWSEYELNNASWLLSNGQFNSGSTYVAVYELLLKIKNGTETKEGVSVKLSTEEYTDTDFVINTADTTFRLPIKVKLASGNAIVGNGMTLGLTDGQRNGGLSAANIAVTSGTPFYNGIYGNPVGTAGSTYDAAARSLGVTSDPTKSGIETSSSGLKLYFYVGETIQDANVIAASQVLTKVANGIDRTVATDRETVVGWGMPDYSAGVSQVEDVEYTAPKAGVLYINAQDYNTNTYITIDGERMLLQRISSNQASSSLATYLIDKGSTYKVEFGRVITGQYITFYPCKGEN